MRQGAHYSVLGGGAWGTALADMVAACGHKVVLYARDKETVDEINTHHQNRRYLGDIGLDHKLQASLDIDYVLGQATRLILAIPAQQLRAFLQQNRAKIAPDCPLIICAKGLEQHTHLTMSEVAKQVLANNPVALLSGPSFASDVAAHLPTAVTLASTDLDLGYDLAHQLSNSYFRCYVSEDVKGVELGGALKNVLAISAGITEGAGLGASAKASVITRGFAEMRRLILAMGGQPQTLTGLAVLGDLMLSASSAQSRNFAYGLAFAKSQPFDKLAEGVKTAEVAAKLAEIHKIETPIITTTHQLLHHTITLPQAISALLQRPVKIED